MEQVVRDYIHVVDLARGHVKALEKFKENKGVLIYNLGTGHGYSVLQVIAAFSKAAEKRSPMRSNRAVQATLLPATVHRQRQKQSLAGKQSMALRRCVLIPGDGSHRTPTDTTIRNKEQTAG